MSRLERIHFDVVGGIAGDMFVAALADAFPDKVPAMLAELGKLAWPEGATVRVAEHRGNALRGSRFLVEELREHRHGQEQGHEHHAWRGIRAMLQDSRLEAPVRDIAVGIFTLLAEAEATVHGIPVDEVGFHEVGAWDSVVNIAAAAYLIDALSPQRWTWSPLPLGGGRVKTQHGVLPVPAPATALLMRGLETLDDGVPGERVTPTGAAILAYLVSLEPRGAGGKVARISASGIGFGTRVMAELPNILRCIAYESAQSGSRDETIATLQFEIDDQPAEDLGIALDRLRAMPGVLEIYQAPVFAKKGRLATQVQILLRTEAVDAVAQVCFEQTTTLGLRIAQHQRRLLSRDEVTAGNVRVKLAHRPSGRRTAKAESDDLAKLPGGRAARDEARRKAEDEALGGASSRKGNRGSTRGH